MLRWSQLRKAIEERITRPLRGRVELHSTRYRRSADQEGRVWITVDGQEVFSMATVIHLVPLWERAAAIATAEPDLSPEAANGRAVAEFAAQGRFTQLTFYSALDEYLNLSIERALGSSNMLIRALALIDRRLGRRRFEALRLAPGEHALVRLSYSLRAEAEGWEPSAQVVA